MANEKDPKLMDGCSCSEFCPSAKIWRRSSESNYSEGIETALEARGGSGNSSSLSESACGGKEVQGQDLGFKRNLGFTSQVDPFSDLPAASLTICGTYEVTDSSYKRKRCQRCHLSSGAREHEVSTGSCDETYVSSNSSTERSQRTTEVQGSRMDHHSSVLKDKCSWSLEFKDLPEAFLETLLMQLPLVSLYQSRLVSRRWNSIISSIISCPQRRKLWAENKPVERWLLLYNKGHEVVFYDVRKNVCYKSRNRFCPLTADSQHHCDLRITSLKATVFASICRTLDMDMLTRIYKCNPLTGGKDELPLMPHNTVWVQDMVAVGGANELPDSFKLLVISWDHRYPGVTRFQLYDSVTRVWEEVANSIVSSMGQAKVVTSFGTSNSKVAVFDKFGTHLRDPTWKFCCYDIHLDEWISHQVQGFQNRSPFWQQWEIFERDWELILLLVDRDPEDPKSSPRAQIWKMPLPSITDQQPLGESPWQLVSSMPDALQVLVFDNQVRQLDASSGTVTTHFKEASRVAVLDDQSLKAFAVADEITGDRLAILSITSKYVVTFNFSIASSGAWAAIPFSALDCRSRQGSGTAFDKAIRRSGRKSSSRSRNVGGGIRRVLTDRSTMGVTFEPDVRWH